MKSYRLMEFGAPLEGQDMPTPQPAGTEVLLRVTAAGVCHSDLHIWEGGYDLGHGRRLALKERGIPLPLTMGHETTGVVVAMGPDAEDQGVAPGAACLVYPWIGCGKCAACQADEENMCARPRSIGIYCDGGYSDHILVPHPRYLLDLGDLDPVTAAPYACSGVTTYSALRKLDHLLQGEPIVIFGAGGLGLMALTILKALGGKGAVVVDIDPKKRQAALAAGALAVVDGVAPDAGKAIIKATGGPPRGIIDLVGSSQTASLGFDCLAKGGKLVIVGLFGGAAPWSLPLIPIKAVTIVGGYVGNLRETRELLDLVRSGAVPPIPVTRRPLAQATQTLDDLREGKLVGRAVLTP